MSTFLSAISGRRHQKEHVDRVVGILDTSPFAFDLTPMGMGKTFTAIAVGEAIGAQSVIVVCLAALEGHWRDHLNGSKGYAVHPSFEVITYDVLHGTVRGITDVAGKALKHGYLNIKYNASVLGIDAPVARTTFIADHVSTDKLRAKFATKTLVIFDEAHSARNISSSTHSSVRAFIDAMRGTESRALLMSGTIIDTPYQAMNIMALVGIVSTNVLTVEDRANRVHRAACIEELARYCHTHTRELTPEDPVDDYLAVMNPDGTPRTAEQIAFDFITQEILPKVATSMTVAPEICERRPVDPMVVFETGTEKEVRVFTGEDEPVIGAAGGPGLNTDITLECYRVFFDYKPDDEARLTAAMEELARIREAGRVAGNTWSSREVRRSILVITEGFKVDYIANEALKILATNPAAKVVVALNYIDNIERMARRIKRLYPDVGVITGDTNKSTRDHIVRQFQTGSRRVIVANTHVVAYGISLDDQVGDSPRFALMSPTLYATDQHQFIRRFYRSETKSTPNVRIVLGSTRNGTTYEESEEAVTPQAATDRRDEKTLERMKKRAAVMRAITPANAAGSILFYDAIPERDGNFGVIEPVEEVRSREELVAEAAAVSVVERHVRTPKARKPKTKVVAPPPEEEVEEVYEEVYVG